MKKWCSGYLILFSHLVQAEGSSDLAVTASGAELTPDSLSIPLPPDSNVVVTAVVEMNRVPEPGVLLLFGIGLLLLLLYRLREPLGNLLFWSKR